MKKDDVELLREIQKNTEMGLHALEIMENKVYDDKLSLQLIRESFKYGELHDRAKAQLLAAKQEVIGQIIDKALASLLNLPEEEYFATS